MKEAYLGTGKLEPSNEGYSLAKIAGIRLIQAFSEEQRKDFFSLIPSNLYGPNDNFDLFTSHVPAALIRKFHEAKISGESVVQVWGTGKARREFLHVDDLAKACWFFLNRNIDQQVINIGTGEDITIKRFSRLVAEITGYHGEISFDKNKPDGMPRKVLDIKRAQKYGWSPTISLEEGLKQTYTWFQDAWRNRELRGIQDYIEISSAKEC
jgi:GDP-L-fucose synthase